MLQNKLKRWSFLNYWTLRYIITLFIGLLIIGVVSVLWIRESTRSERLESLKSLTQSLSAQVVSADGRIHIPANFYEFIDNNQRTFHIPGQFSLLVIDSDKQILFTKTAPIGPSDEPAIEPGTSAENTASATISHTETVDPPGNAQEAPPEKQPANQIDSGSRTSIDVTKLPDLAPDDTDIQVSTSEQSVILLSPIMNQQNAIIGDIAIEYGRSELERVDQSYSFIGVLLVGMALLGWMIIYLLSRKLTTPIVAVAAALQKIEKGDYNIQLREQVKEKELHELLVSFSRMAARLEHLEQLRTELLAGVTHELKTPITSIHGLLHAIRDQVVTGDEADEFLDISIKETQRLQAMVTELLDFNAFATRDFSIQQERIDLGKLVSEIVYQWGLIYENGLISLSTAIPPNQLIALGDASRIQQILINLLNNSKQSFAKPGVIRVEVTELSQSELGILVSDTGSGIPEAEQKNIFERYYRGQNKKMQVRGLGLGLTFSQTLAAAMGGRLQLNSSSPAGSTFQLALPRA